MSLYPIGNSWDNVVVQVFSSQLFEKVSLHAIPLHCEDIRAGKIALSRDERVTRIARSLAECSPSIKINSADSFALTFIDGVSSSEDYFMEAVYQSGRFPCLFVGGSVGGKLDFQNTYIFDGKRLLENHAVVCFVKMAAGKRYSVLKTQNFKPSAHAFTVVDASPELRRVKAVIDQKTGQVIPFLEALSKTLGVPASKVSETLNGQTFAVDVDGEMFVRSVASVNEDDGSLSFFCAVNAGDNLQLVHVSDFVGDTKRAIEHSSGTSRVLSVLFWAIAFCGV